MSLNETNLVIADVENEGEVAAGRVLWFPQASETNQIPLTPQQAELAKKGLIKTMTVDGRSLEDIGIYHGDKLLCAKVFHRKEIKQDTVCIVYVAELGETVAKKVRFGGDKVLLKSCNRDVEDFYVPAEQADIRGIVIELIRRPDGNGRFDRGYNEFEF